jgi:hypothetical protein
VLYASAALAFCAVVWSLVILVRLRPHRIDLRPDQHLGEGTSSVWQQNVTDPRNYDDAGRRLLAQLSAAQLLTLGSLIVAVVAAVRG